MDEGAIQHAGRLITAARRILVTTHIRPDGDAIGSTLGLGLALQQAGKQVQMVIADGAPRLFRYLPGAEQVQTETNSDADLTVVLDCSDLQRVGGVLDQVSVPDLNLDHHVTNLNFARVNLVDLEAVATTAILTECLPVWGLPVTPDVAANLLTGIITDTIGFRTTNMSSKALRLAADLVDKGVNISDLYHRSLVQRTFEAVRYWGAGLSRIERQGPIVWTSLLEADRQQSGYLGQNDADLVNFLATIEDGEVAIVFVELDGRKVKVSWRSTPPYDVSEIAYRFGGGGHPAAAGAEFKGSLEGVKQVVLQATLALFAPVDQEMSLPEKLQADNS